ncbi:hypothetical protein RUM44_000697 [Polyplax serrata]|uniref:Uncharacterized protein n=1 Tax=Polyplax serrata TaxID=468196 RepID=A0ABR1B8C8_POLSC
MSARISHPTMEVRPTVCPPLLGSHPRRMAHTAETVQKGVFATILPGRRAKACSGPTSPWDTRYPARLRDEIHLRI